MLIFCSWLKFKFKSLKSQFIYFSQLRSSVVRIYPAHPNFRGQQRLEQSFMYNICKLSLALGSLPTYFPAAEFILNSSFSPMPNRQTGFFLVSTNQHCPDKDLHPDYKLFKRKDLHTFHLEYHAVLKLKWYNVHWW